MIQIVMTETERANLLAFLNRTNLTGAEVPAFTEVQIAIAKGVSTHENRQQE